MSSSRARAKEIAHEALAAGTPTAWFERLYREAAGNHRSVPWADMKPNWRLEQWCMENQIKGEERTACVVGAGLGDDAEALCAVGFRVTAFDLSETAVAWAKKRYPDTVVTYEVLDLFEAPAKYPQGFDLVFEAYTVQSMPLSLRAASIEALAKLVAPKGSLLLIARLRPNEELPEGPPWPLSLEELAPFDEYLKRLRFEPYVEPSDPDTARFIAEYRR